MTENGVNEADTPTNGGAPEKPDEMLVKDTELEERAGGKEAAEGAEAEETPEAEELTRKRARRASRKELLELIHRKNEMLIEKERTIAKSAQHVDIAKDRLLRLAAEFENYKKRTRREWELLQQKANADLIKDIIGAIDNFDRAFASMGPAEGQYYEGLRLIYDGLMDVLRRAGLKEIPGLGQAFNPLFHEAVGEIEGGEVETGHVAQVVQRGYMLNDFVVRPARVLVERQKQS